MPRTCASETTGFTIIFKVSLLFLGPKLVECDLKDQATVRADEENRWRAALPDGVIAPSSKRSSTCTSKFLHVSKLDVRGTYKFETVQHGPMAFSSVNLLYTPQAPRP